MKKSAFTLSELLVTLGIIGVVGVMLVPIYGNIMPDKEKMIVLKTAKILADINYELLNNNAYYWTPRGNDCEGFGCTQAPLDQDLAGFSGAEKYPRLLASKLHIKTDALPDNFVTQDNMLWSFVSGDFVNNDSVILQIDTDLNNNSVTMFGGAGKVDTFQFIIDINGHVFGAEPLTRVYLNNPHKLNDRKADYAEANRLSGNNQRPIVNPSAGNEKDITGDSGYSVGQDNEISFDQIF